MFDLSRSKNRLASADRAAQLSQNTLPAASREGLPEQDGMRRRDLLKLAAFAVAGWSSVSPVESGIAEEPSGMLEGYQLRDLHRSYELWKQQPGVTEFPPFEEFVRSVEVCRTACCVVNLMNGPGITANHSGFIVSIPAEHRTSRSAGKSYVVTCDHGHRGFPTAKAKLFLVNGQNVVPSAELIEDRAPDGGRRRDLRIYECDPAPFKGLSALPLYPTSRNIRPGSAAMTYEPLNLRGSMRVHTETGFVERAPLEDGEGPREKFVLSRVSQPREGGRGGEYPYNTEFCLAGQLQTGGSGSPTLVFRDGALRLSGYQVSYSPEADQGDHVDGELRCDANIVHIADAIDLLTKHGRWR